MSDSSIIRALSKLSAYPSHLRQYSPYPDAAGENTAPSEKKKQDIILVYTAMKYLPPKQETRESKQRNAVESNEQHAGIEHHVCV